MSRLGAAVLGVVVVSACAHYNTLYNAEHLWVEAEELRRGGQDSLARARYEDVIRKTAEAYRARPSSQESSELLLYMGRAQLRVGRAREAQAALTEATSMAADRGDRATALVFLGMAAARMGDTDEARSHVEEAILEGLTGSVSAQAYLLRGRLRLSEGNAPAGWDDLDRAGAADDRVALEAGLEKLEWAIRYGESSRAEGALEQLLREGEAAERLDTIAALLDAAADEWGPSTAAAIVSEVGSAAWGPAGRSKLELRRARLLRDAGDTVAAEAQAWVVARGRGEGATDARLLLAQWHLDRTRDLGDAQAVVPVLLPVAHDPRAATLVEAVDDLARLSGLGLDDPLGWFAAAEVARTRLSAPVLARGLYLAYADTDPTDPWAPKALLAALTVSQDDEDRAWLRGRLEAHQDSPYVEAARGGTAADFESLEEELQGRLREIASR